ncbi:hypothetical protein AJ87_29610 [Rhizobium yanglingense]|nr:hypothetical protein AJ87_29610 [Rhizobium yanglingense]
MLVIVAASAPAAMRSERSMTVANLAIQRGAAMRPPLERLGAAAPAAKSRLPRLYKREPLNDP